MLYIVTFLYGVIGGAICCLIFFVVVFNKIEALMMNVIRKKALKHAAFIAVAKEAAVVPPAKVETLCKIVNFDHDVVGTVIQCRAVMYSNTLNFYAIDRLETLPDHRQVVQMEHLLGKVNRSCVEVSSKKLSKYHRHIHTDSLTASLKGKCTILTAKEGLSLFLPDTETLLQLRLDRIREEQEARGKRHHIRHHSVAAGVSPRAEEKTCESPMHRLDDPQPLAVSKDGVMYSFDTVGAALTEEGEGPLALHNPTAYKANPTPLDISTWRAIAIKFPTRRENERWLNLLQANARTELFQEYLTHMPQRDVFNLLIARLFFENTSSNRLHDILTDKIQHKFEALSRSLGQNVKGNIYLDGLTIGGEVPLISSVSEGTISPSGDFEFGFDVLYRGGLILLIRFSITYREIKVPDIVFTIRVLELAGRMRMNIGPPPTRKFWLGCPKPPELRLDISQEVVKEGLLGNLISLLPDLGEILSNVVREKIFEDMILPKYDDFPWPSFDEPKEEEKGLDDAEGSEELGSMSMSSRQAGVTDSKKGEKDKNSEKKKKKKHHFFRSKKSKDGEQSSSSNSNDDDDDDNFSEGQSFQSASLSASAKKRGADKASCASAGGKSSSPSAVVATAAATTPTKTKGKKPIATTSATTATTSATATSVATAAPTANTSSTDITEKKQEIIKDYWDGVLHETVSPSVSGRAEEEKRLRGAAAGGPTYRSSGGAAVLARPSPGEAGTGRASQQSPASAQVRAGSIQSSVSADTFISYGAAAVAKTEREAKKRPEKK